MRNMTFWASVLLYKGKIKFWKVSPNKRSTVGDFYKDFIYSGRKLKDYINDPNCQVITKQFVEGIDGTNDEIFNILVPEWYKQWELGEDFVGNNPHTYLTKSFFPSEDNE